MEHGTSKHLVCKKEEIKCNSIIKHYKKWLTLKMLRNKTYKKHNLNWLKILDHPKRLLKIGGSGSGKASS